MELIEFPHPLYWL